MDDKDNDRGAVASLKGALSEKGVERNEKWPLTTSCVLVKLVQGLALARRDEIMRRGG